MEARGGVAIFTTTRQVSVFHHLTLQSSVVAHCVCVCVLYVWDVRGCVFIQVYL